MMNRVTVVQKTPAPVAPQSTPVMRPDVDIYENSEEFLLYVAMPGVAKEDIAIDLENNVLSLSGVRHHEVQGCSRFKEFSSVEYRNSFSIPETIERIGVKAKLDAGVLFLTLPKLEAVKPRVIKVH